jgi:hypothetical protein
MKFVAQHKGNTISSISLAGKEYKAEDGIIEVPDDHHEARKAAIVAGLEHASVVSVEESSATKKAGKDK